MGLNVEMVVLSRFLCVAGQIALRQVIHLDTYILNELKRRNYLKDEQDQKNKGRKSSKKKKSKRKMTNESTASPMTVSERKNQL